MISFNEYQDAAASTALYSKHTLAVIYPALGLNGEAGEVAESIKKSIRRGDPFDREALLLELGDVLWYIAAMASDLGLTLQQVAEANIAKLAARKAAGTVVAVTR